MDTPGQGTWGLWDLQLSSEGCKDLGLGSLVSPTRTTGHGWSRPGGPGSPFWPFIPFRPGTPRSPWARRKMGCDGGCQAQGTSNVPHRDGPGAGSPLPCCPQTAFLPAPTPPSLCFLPDPHVLSSPPAPSFSLLASLLLSSYPSRSLHLPHLLSTLAPVSFFSSRSRETLSKRLKVKPDNEV